MRRKIIIITLLHLFLDESEGPRELLTIPTCAHAVLDVVYFSTVIALATWLSRSTTIRLVIDDFSEDGLELLEYENAGSPITERAWPSREHALERLQVHWVFRDAERRGVTKGDPTKVFDAVKVALGDLVTGERMYFYLVDELTGEPVRGEGYPIEITKPSAIVPKLLPVMQVGMRAMSLYNGAAGIARMFGYPVPTVPEKWRKGAQSSVEMLKLVRI